MFSFSTVRPDQSNLTGPTQYGPAPILVRDPLDAARSLLNRDPDAQYPSGYIDSGVNTRRTDPQSSVSLWNTRPYDRGASAHSKLSVDAYLWPAEFNLASGIENQMRTRQQYIAPAMAAGEPPILVNDGRPNFRDSAILADPNTPLAGLPEADQVAAYRGLLPSWS